MVKTLKKFYEKELNSDERIKLKEEQIKQKIAHLQELQEIREELNKEAREECLKRDLPSESFDNEAVVILNESGRTSIYRDWSRYNGKLRNFCRS